MSDAKPIPEPDGEQPARPSSVDRRGFFRQILLQTVEGIEKVGKTVVQRHATPRVLSDAQWIEKQARARMASRSSPTGQGISPAKTDDTSLF